MRWIRFTLIAVAVLIVVAGAATVTLLTIDLGRFKGNLEDFVSEATGREFVIAGRFEPSIGKTVDLLVENVRLANADWGTAENILEIERLVVSIDTLSLLSDPAEILNLEVDGFALHVEKNPATGRWSWSFSDEPAPVDDADDEPFRLPLWLEEARLQDITITYGRGWLDEPHTVTVSDARFSSDDQDLLTMRLAGAIDEDQIVADGLVGPLEALVNGKEPRWELEATIGQFATSTKGTFRNLFSLEGPSVQAMMRGPSAERALARFGLPALARGPVDLTIDIAEDADRISLRADGEFGDLTTDVVGHAQSLTTLADMDLSLDIRGPNLGALGALFGAAFLPATEFAVSGGVTTSRESMRVDSLIFRAGDARVEANGTLAPPAVDADARMDLTAHLPELLEFLPPALENYIPAGALDANAVVAGAPQQPEVRHLEARLGDDILAVELADSNVDLVGLFQNPLTLDGKSASIDIRGVTLEPLLQPWVDVEVPDLAFDIKGSLTGADGAMLMSDVTFHLGDLAGTLQGTTGELPSLVGLRIENSFTGTNINQFKALLADPDTNMFLPDEDYDSHTILSKTGDGWFVESSILRIGETRFEWSGALGDLSAPAGIDIDLKTSGPDLRMFVPESVLDEPVPYAFSGGFKIGDTEIELQEIDLRIGRTTAWLNGSLPTSEQMMNAEFDVRLEGPDLERVGRALGFEGLPAEAFSFEGALDRSGQSYRVENMRAVVGDNDLGGELELEIGETLGIRGQLESDHFDLTELVGKEEEERDDVTMETGDRVIPDIPVSMDFLDIADVDVSLRLREFVTEYFGFGDVELALRIEDDALHLDSTRVSLTHGGTLATSLDLARTAEGQADVKLRADAKQFRLRPPIDSEGTAVLRPAHDLMIDLSGSGTTLRELVATADGSIELSIGKGDVDNRFRGYMLRDFVSTIFSAVNPLAKNSRYTTLNCGFAVLDFGDGIATTRALGFQTEQLAVASLGTIDLATEAVDLSYRVKQREGVGFSVASVTNPYIRVGGTLAKPAIRIDKKRGLLTGTVAVLTGGLSILAQGAWDRYLSADNYCEVALEAIDAGELPGMQDE